MLQTIIIIGIGVVIVLLLWVIFELRKKGAGGTDEKLIRIDEKVSQIPDISKTLDQKLAESMRLIQNQFGQSAKIIQDVTEKLTKLDETNKQVLNFSDQLKSLQDILKNPKQRGILGEYYLETVLKNVLPPKTYQMQYKFKNGDTVDAVIFLGDKILPIDSKFSLENYNRIMEERNEQEREKLEKQFKQDLKNRIDETAKYIRPEEKTYDIAFMFIPSEAIYYDLLVTKVGAIKVSTRDLIEYAIREKKVHIVSPTTFLVYLQMFLQGLKSYEIEKSTEEIIKRVEQLARHMGSYESFLQKLGNNLSTTVGSYNSAYKEFKKIDKDVLKISGAGGKVEALELEKPKQE